jgi:hypothetical protein
MKGQAVNALCQMTGLNRAGFYRSRRLRQASPVEMEIRDEMQKIALESPAYGYRRITVELQRHGFDINDKRVLRMMLEDNLLCIRLRAFVATTDSRHNRPAYLPQPGARPHSHGDQPALGGRYHLHSIAGGVRLPGGCARCLFAARDRLGTGTDAGGGTGWDGLAYGVIGEKPRRAESPERWRCRRDTTFQKWRVGLIRDGAIGENAETL